MEHLLQKESGHEVHKKGKIVVIGQSDVKPEVLLSIAKQLGLDKKRFELYLEYEDAKKFNFQKMQWQPTYSLLMVGPMPHSGSGKGDYYENSWTNTSSYCPRRYCKLFYQSDR